MVALGPHRAQRKPKSGPDPFENWGDFKILCTLATCNPQCTTCVSKDILFYWFVKLKTNSDKWKRFIWHLLVFHVDPPTHSQTHTPCFLTVSAVPIRTIDAPSSSARRRLFSYFLCHSLFSSIAQSSKHVIIWVQRLTAITIVSVCFHHWLAAGLFKCPSFHEHMYLALCLRTSAQNKEQGTEVKAIGCLSAAPTLSFANWLLLFEKNYTCESYCWTNVPPVDPATSTSAHSHSALCTYCIL